MTKLYRPCVGIALFNNDGLVFVGERIDTPGAWQMPQGGIDEGEDIALAMKRELKEEIGTYKVEIIKIIPEKIRYDLPDEMRKRLWDGKYAGQEQTWVAARFLGKDSDIDLAAHDPPEFRKWQWIPLEKTVDLIVPFKRETYRKVIELLHDVIPSEVTDAKRL
ncbi:MAG: RNA pyrophosphohydrolase [Alphaproteobacteria bacterium]|nr:RNA pyrophosphohydrolase [Alphaproteobacteria bacterium]